MNSFMVWITTHKRLSIVAGVICLLLALVAFKNGKSNGAEFPVQRGTLIEAVYGIGTVTARKTYDLKVGVSTTLSKNYVDEGQSVTPGEPLLLLEGMPLFRAPFAGVITAIPYKIGETVFPQTPILTLTDLRDLYIVVSLEQQTMVHVHKGQPTRLSFENMRDKSFQGSVRTLFSHEGQFLVHLDAKDLPPEILPGMTADIGIEIGRRENALMVPVAALSNHSLIVSKGGKQKEIQVKVGVIDADRAEILEGDLEEGDQVIVRTKGK